MRFLCASNLHLGRRISGLPEHAGLDPARVSASTVWSRLVNAALTYEVDAILLAGDVIDRENAQFEPLGALQQGLGLLERKNIPVIAIAGDEDFDSLPRAIDALDSELVTLLDHDRPSFDVGRNGDRVSVIGRSQAGHVDAVDGISTLMQVETSQPTIVMLHGSLTDGHAPAGTFQPLRLDDLAASGTDVWILGAQREPDVVVLDSTTVIETGAAFPMDPTETGVHGATLVELFDDGAVVCELIPLSPVQFEDIDIDLTDLETLEAVEGAIVRALYDTLDDATATDAVASLAAVLCPIHLTGTTSLHAELPALLDELERTIAAQQQGVMAAIQSVEIDTRPEIDIEPLVRRPDPVGELARLLRSLDEDEPRTSAQEALLQRAVDRLVGAHRSRVFAGVANDSAPDAEAARTLLRREGWNVLDALVCQRGVD
jgi:DNA repair exonuclease SbcCD nuclease subunit